MSGRDLFTFDPNLVAQDEDDIEGGVAYEVDHTEDREDDVKLLNVDLISILRRFVALLITA